MTVLELRVTLQKHQQPHGVASFVVQPDVANKI